MKLLLLGRSGQVGWELQRALAPLGEVVALTRADLDLENLDCIAGTIEAHRPDVVINAMAYTAVDAAESDEARASLVNSRAVGVLAELAERGGYWLVHYSTDYVFDGTKPSPYIESDPAAPLSAYGRGKLGGEEAISRSGCRHLIFRTSWVHAPRGNNFVRTILRLSREREGLRIVADQHGAPTSAELIADVTAHALARIAAEAGSTRLAGTYHLSALGETSWHALACFVVEEALALGGDFRLRPAAIEPITTAQYPTAAVRPANSRLDTTRLRAAFGVALPAWQAGVRRTVAEALGA